MMRPVFCRLALASLAAVSAVAVGAAAATPSSFSQSLTSEQKQQLGLASLTPAQFIQLDAAIGAYARGEMTVAVAQAVQQEKKKTDEHVRQAEKKAADAVGAAATAVADYKKKQEPGVIARTLEVLKRKQEEDKREKITGRVVGEFRGWRGGTYFPLDNGQVWRQTGTEENELPPLQNAEVEIVKSASGYWRLSHGGAWITVKRLQ